MIVVLLNTKVLHDSPCYGTTMLRFLLSGNELTFWEDGSLEHMMHELLIVPILCQIEIG